MLTFATLITSLFFIMNPIGDVPTFISLLARFSEKKQRLIILRESIIGIAVLILFAMWGEKILHYMNISTTAVTITGGIILFIIAIHMIFPVKQPEDEKSKIPFIVPLAIPLIADPGLISTLVVYSHQITSKLELLAALFIAWAVSTCIYLSAAFIKRALGNRGVNALEKIGGIVLTMIAIQTLIDGVEKIALK
ncbi:NAAT family transporter [bacterium]|jgi:multiple antibiotic resistance protein|nr:NAAT family transporter [bacterium]